jgi:hypothetical protein
LGRKSAEEMSEVYRSEWIKLFFFNNNPLLSVRDRRGNPLKKIGTKSPAPMELGKRPVFFSLVKAKFTGSNVINTSWQNSY